MTQLKRGGCHARLAVGKDLVRVTEVVPTPSSAPAPKKSHRKLKLALAVLAGLVLSGATTFGLSDGVASASAKTPKTCKNALGEAEKIMEQQQAVTDAYKAHYERSTTAAQAMTTGTITEVTAFLQTMSASIRTLTGDLASPQILLKAITPNYQADAKACREGK
jgi:hypothetical protein